MTGTEERKSKKQLLPAQKWVIGLAFLVLTMGLANLGRAGLAVHYAIHLPDLPMTVTWRYLAAMGGFWGIALTACVLGLLRFRPWGRWGAMAAVSLYEIHVWVNHFLFDASEYARRTRPRDLALTGLFLTLVLGTLHWPSVTRVFRTDRGGEVPEGSLEEQRVEKKEGGH